MGTGKYFIFAIVTKFAGTWSNTAFLFLRWVLLCNNALLLFCRKNASSHFLKIKF